MRLALFGSYLALMQGYWVRLGAEFVARRRRLREAMDDRTASLIEFAAVSGLVLGPLALAVAPEGLATAPWAAALPIALVLGYLSLEARRQKAESAGAPGAERRFDRWTLALVGLGAAAGLATLVFAMLAPEPPEPYFYAPPEPPAKSFAVDIEG